ncbi:hypothetical protein MMC21_002911 [Puttea exsequens]|nr:hypothetical protein [Puttea exsequens]
MLLLHGSMTTSTEQSATPTLKARRWKATKSAQSIPDTAPTYYLSSISHPFNEPSQEALPDFENITDFGIFPWWPTSEAAKAYRILNPDVKKTPIYEAPDGEDPYETFVTDFAVDNTADLLELIGQTPDLWSFPVCDQGRNFWTYDWSDNGGLEEFGHTWPCARDFHGSGTAAFYKALGIDGFALDEILAGCSFNLSKIDPALSVDNAENIGWNVIAGGMDDGWSPKTILQETGGTQTLTAPGTMPTQLCHVGVGCPGRNSPAPEPELEIEPEDNPFQCDLTNTSPFCLGR